MGATDGDQIDSSDSPLPSPQTLPSPPLRLSPPSPSLPSDSPLPSPQTLPSPPLPSDSPLPSPQTLPSPPLDSPLPSPQTLPSPPLRLSPPLRSAWPRGDALGRACARDLGRRPPGDRGHPRGAPHRRAFPPLPRRPATALLLFHHIPHATAVL